MFVWLDVLFHSYSAAPGVELSLPTQDLSTKFPTKTHHRYPTFRCSIAVPSLRVRYIHAKRCCHFPPFLNGFTPTSHLRRSKRNSLVVARKFLRSHSAAMELVLISHDKSWRSHCCAQDVHQCVLVLIVAFDNNTQTLYCNLFSQTNTRTNVRAPEAHDEEILATTDFAEMFVL